MGERRGAYRGFGGENLRREDNSQDPGIDGRILRWESRKWNWGARIGLIWLRIWGRCTGLVNAVMRRIKC